MFFSNIRIRIYGKYIFTHLLVDMGLIKRIYYKSLTDEALIDLMKNQETEAFSELYLRYAHLVIGVCMKYLKNKMLAEDITMQVFEKIQHKLKTHTISNFKSWLYMVTKNECFIYLRTVKSFNETADFATLSIEDEEEDAVLKDVKYELLEKQLNDLKEDQRDCLVRFYLKNESYQQISDALNISINQVKSALQNGKRNLKINLEKHSIFQETTNNED
jgi:RNA polymerase sigma-70 factor (ECF subfamily)